MVLVAVTVAVAVAAGWLRGGRLRTIGRARVEGAGLAVAAAAAQLVAAWVGTAPATRVLTVASQVAVLAVVWRNRMLAGALLIALGSTANAAVIAVNGAMPVSRSAVLAVTRHPAELTAGRHRLLEPSDALPWLADVIPLPLLRTVVSVGDVLLAAGIGLLVMHLMIRPVSGRRARSAAEPVDGVNEPLA
ncbi:MAG TPA: DUF5317 family protein [Egibacteraceae bacterium]|nr:DUF5317 family protein [Egibacteraceae bacterium]